MILIKYRLMFQYQIGRSSSQAISLNPSKQGPLHLTLHWPQHLCYDFGCSGVDSQQLCLRPGSRSLPLRLLPRSLNLKLTPHLHHLRNPLSLLPSFILLLILRIPLRQPLFHILRLLEPPMQSMPTLSIAIAIPAALRMRLLAEQELTIFTDPGDRTAFTEAVAAAHADGVPAAAFDLVWCFAARAFGVRGQRYAGCGFDFGVVGVDAGLVLRTSFVRVFG